MMNEFEAQVLSDLSVLKSQMTGLMGEGNGGRLADLERRMERHEENWQRAKGISGGIERAVGGGRGGGSGVAAALKAETDETGGTWRGSGDPRDSRSGDRRYETVRRY